MTWRFIICALLFPSIISAQCLSTSVSLDCNPCTTQEAIDKLESQVPCSFSYNAGKISPDEEINATFSEATLQQSIKRILGNNIDIQERGRHIIILHPSKEQVKKSTVTFSGRITNARSSKPIQNATVYLVGEKNAVLSDDQGNYRLEYEGTIESPALSISRQHYFDTILISSTTGPDFVQDVALKPRPSAPELMPTRDPDIPYRPTEVEELPMVKLLVPDVQAQRAMNLDYLEEIPIQLSVIPSVGTNKLTSGFHENILSLNLIAGYNAGVTGLEVGGGVNIDRQDVLGIQAAGIGNIVGGKVQGVQAAGIFNNVRGSIHGVQAGGIYNIVLDTITGVQAGGIFNVLNGTISGAQFGGIFNIATGDMNGLQAGGIFNIVHHDVSFAQVGGIFNLADDVSGLQLAGILNHASGHIEGLQIGGLSNYSGKEVTGGQVAGLWNIAVDTLQGTQVSGLGNYAKDVKGTQITGLANVSRDINVQIAGLMNIGRTVDKLQLGLLNFSDSAAHSIGLLSFSLKGVNSLGLSADEVIPFNATYRTGSKLFYNMLYVGFGSYPGLNLFSYGYGLGTDLGKPSWRLHFHTEVLARQIMHLDNPSPPLNLQLRWAPYASYRIGQKHFKLNAGPTFNILLRNGLVQNTDPDVGQAYGPRDPDSYPPIYTSLDSENIDGRAWIGWKVELMW